MDTLYEDVFTFMTVCRWFLLRMRNVSNKSCREKTHILCAETFFSPRKSFRDEIMSKNMVQRKRTQTIWRLRIAYWIRKPTRARTHTEICNTYCFSTATVLSWTRLNVTLYVHCLYCWMYPKTSKNAQWMVPWGEGGCISWTVLMRTRWGPFLCVFKNENSFFLMRRISDYRTYRQLGFTDGRLNTGWRK
jgi:hypothetical protein